MGAFNETPPSNDHYVPVPTPDKHPEHVVEQIAPTVTPAEQGNYDSTMLDSHYHDLRTYIHRMEGTTLTTQFYHQLLGATDSPERFDPHGQNSSQQLRRIRNLDMKLKGDLSFSKDPEKNEVSITGEASLYPGFTPNKFDTFIADAGEGRQYWFVVEEVKELSPRRDRVVDITFSVIKVIEDSDKALLDSCVVDSQIFTKEFVSENGYLDEAKLPALREIQSFTHTGWLMYFDCFYAPDQRTFLLESDDGKRLYDAFLNRFVRAITPDWGRFANIEVGSFYIGWDNERIHTLWDLLLDGNRNYWPLLNREFVEHNVHSIGFSIDRDSIRYSQVDAFAYPVDENNTLLTEYRRTRRDLQDSRSEPLPLLPNDPTQIDPDTTYVASTPVKHPDDDFYYVLSAAFYQEVSDAQSSLERLVSDYLDNKPVDPELLHNEFKHVTAHPDDKVRYYHLPILLLLSKSIINFDRF